MARWKGAWVALVGLGRLMMQLTGSIYNCGEPQGPPAPRADWPGWMDFHHQLVTEVSIADGGDGYEFLFYGDSITETWRGTDHGRGGNDPSCDRCAGCPQVWDKYFGSVYRSDALAIGGDQAAHLMWRLQDSEAPRQRQPTVVAVMIGTNDLGAAECGDDPDALLNAAPGTADRVIGILDFLHQQLPGSHILAVGILPRSHWEPWGWDYKWPNIYTKPIEQINARLQEFTQADDHLHYVDCGAVLIQGGSLHADLQPDALHPSAAGMELFAGCLAPVVARLAGRGGLPVMNGGTNATAVA